MFSHIQEFFDFCRTGNFDKASHWIQNKTKKSKLNFLRPHTPNVGWLNNLRDPATAYTALHLAALNGHHSICKLLLEQDDQLITSIDRRGCLPLHLAAWNGHSAVVQYLTDVDVSTIDEVNNAKESSLHLAAQHGHGKVVATLLQKHANARLRNARFETALDIAARTGKENVCQLLICHCPELALQSAAECSRADNKTISQHVVYPLHVAARHGHIECLRVLCQSGFDINYVTEEGTALHVAALFGQVEAVKLLLKHNIDVYVKDSQGKTVLEKLEEHENQKATDITQIIQSREGWAECRKIIEEYLRNRNNSSKKEVLDEKDIIWRTLPPNSAASNGLPKSIHRTSTGTTSSNNGIYYPPSMTVDHVILDDEYAPSNHVSTLSLSSNHHSSELNTSMNESTADNASACSVSPSIASNSSHSRVMHKFPVTSPNAKTRHANARRFGNSVLINGIEPKMMPQPGNLTPEHLCNYQPPPQYETWQKKQSQEHLGLPGSQNNTYRNIPQPYDNAPLGAHRRWEHCCQNHANFSSNGHAGIKNTKSTGTVGTSNGRNLTNSQLLREDGTQTIPVKFGSRQRPTILNDIFTQTIPEHSERSPSPPLIPPKPALKDSKSTDFASLEKRTPSRTSNVTFASSTLDRSTSPTQNRSKYFNGKAPLALPEELGGSITNTSIMSMSPERVLNPIDERLRRSMTTTSEDRTLVSMHEDFSSPNDEQLKSEQLSNQTKTSAAAAAVINSPESIVSSEHTADSSCSLPQISQISSSSISPSQTGISEIGDKSDSSNIVVSMRQNRGKRHTSNSSTTRTSSGTTRSATADIDQIEEWKKIEEILNAIRRDSLFAEPNNSQVAVSVRNRKSQALTLQLSSVNMPISPNDARQSAAFFYPSESEDLKGAPNRSTVIIGEKMSSVNEVMEWLHTQVGLPVARSIEISAILERNGFDMVKFMKSTLSKSLMTDMGIDKSIQHQILSFLDSQRPISFPRINEFEYASDWLSSLHLIDYLGLFAKQKLTLTKAVRAAALTRSDLRRMGIDLIGHLERIQRSLCVPNDQMDLSSLSSLPNDSMKSTSTINTESTPHRESSEETIDNSAKWEEKTTQLLHKCASYSAHYLGSAEISNVEGAEDCRRAMNTLKSRIRQIAKVPQVLLEISVGGVNVLDSSTNRLTVQHEINRIQVVCQDELDLNCFAYIFQDGDKNFCHVYCVLTAEMARDIIMTLGHAFNLAYNLALGNTGS
jgi:ankyrin repeat protein